MTNEEQDAEINKMLGELGVVELNAFYFHEVLHTAHIIGEMFNTYICENPAVLQTPQLRSRAKDIARLLGDFYQAAGRYHL
jgi:hypothetical protein